MYKMLKAYSDSNPERFNRDFIMSRSDEDIIDYVRDIFKTLEILPEIKIIDVHMETDESNFEPIKMTGSRKKKVKKEDTEEQETSDEEDEEDSSVAGSEIKKGHGILCYKSIVESRMNKIMYKILVVPQKKDEVTEYPLLEGKRTSHINVDEIVVPAKREDPDEPFYVEGFIYLNKLIDGAFYINEGSRYFLIRQIVDNVCYSTGSSISLKSLLMPINMSKSTFYAEPEFNKEPVELPAYEVLLFRKIVNPLIYIMLKEGYNSIIRFKYTDEELKMYERMHYKDETLIDKLNTFFNVNFKFSDDITTFEKDDIVFQSKNDKTSGCYIGCNEEEFNSNPMCKILMGCLLNMVIPGNTKKKKVAFTYDDLISPWFWIETAGLYFISKNSDPERRLLKMMTVLISLERLIDDASYKILQLDPYDKENCLTIMRYMMREYDVLIKKDSLSLDDKRVRVQEYLLLPLQIHFSNQIYRVLNNPVHSGVLLEKMFTGLKPTYIIKQMVVNELLRFYNASNAFCLYTCLLKYTFSGTQAINGSTASNKQRGLHPSYTGRISIVSASAGSPGLSGNLTPFCETYSKYGFFNKEYSDKVNDDK